ncbi:hypothetical protein B566_EDAN001461 [Ephemera danica]|nr:hypothetical protein B566_EDAN001461 [Ephemera danica]
MRLVEDQQNAGDALAPQGIAVALISLGSLCCLVFVTIGMGLKLLKFRRQMRLGRFSQATAATSAKMDMAASMTNVPSQGVFRIWNISEEGPPDPPPRVLPVRPKTMEVPAAKPKKKQVRPKSLDTAHVTEMGVDVVGVPSPSGKKEKVDKKSRPKSLDTSLVTPDVPVAASKTKGKKEKTKAVPPSRRNPNAPAFARNSIITNVPSTAQPPSPPPMAMNHILIKTNPQVSRTEVSNGSLPAPRSPVPVKAPKTKLAKSSKKNRPVSLPALNARPEIVPHMSPTVAQGPTSPVPIVTSPDFEETGVFTFQQSRRDSPEPYDMPPSFLYGGVYDDEECDA